jgi:hypothetical protein
MSYSEASYVLANIEIASKDRPAINGQENSVSVLLHVHEKIAIVIGNVYDALEKEAIEKALLELEDVEEIISRIRY